MSFGFLWSGWTKTTIIDVHLIKDLKPIAKCLRLKLLKNKDKTAHIRAIASTLLKQGKVVVKVSLKNINRNDTCTCCSV